MNSKEHPGSNQVVKWKRETWPNKTLNPMLNSGLRGLHGHGHFYLGLHGGDNPNYLPHLMFQQLVLNTRTNTSSGRLVAKRFRWCLFVFIILRIDNWRGQSKRDVHTDTHTRVHFSEFLLTDAHVAHSGHFSTFTVQVWIDKSFNQVIRL